MDDTGNVTQNGQQDVDEEISIAATLEEDTQRREEDGKDDLDDVACGERHDGNLRSVFRYERVGVVDRL